MNASKKKLLHLVIYNPNTSYEVYMRRATSRWYDVFEKLVETYFICFQDNITAPTIFEEKDRSRVLAFPGRETFIPGICDKTMKALAFFDRENYCGVVRSNISSVLDFDLLIPLFPGPMSYGSCNNFKHLDALCCCGTNILLGWNVWNFLVEHMDEIDYTIIDDCTISMFLNKRWGTLPLKVTEKPAGPLDTTTPSPVILYRHKSHDRWADLNLIREHINKLFQFRKLRAALPVQLFDVRCGDIDITLNLRDKAEQGSFSSPVAKLLSPMGTESDIVSVLCEDDAVELRAQTATFEATAGSLWLIKLEN